LIVVNNHPYRRRMTRNALLTIDELAAHLGVPTRTLYGWRYRNEGPPAIRVGRHLRYNWADVEAWLDDQRDGSQRRGTSRAGRR
jgi:excisionase family DNA binding protein